jgi:hypothetical protein
MLADCRAPDAQPRRCNQRSASSPHASAAFAVCAPASVDHAPAVGVIVDRFRQAYRERRAVRWSVELAAFALILGLVSAWQTRHHRRGALPAIALRTLDGRSSDLASVVGGRRTLLYVWAPWCTVCKLESANVDRLEGWIGDRARVVSLATEYASVGDVKGYVERAGAHYPVYLAPGVAETLGVSAFPSIFVVDAQGNLVRSVTGYTTTFGLFWRLLLP